MYLVLIAWGYVCVMMAIAEATSPVGSILGAIITLLLYGVLPMGLVAYIMATPERKRRLKQQQENLAAKSPTSTDSHSHKAAPSETKD